MAVQSQKATLPFGFVTLAWLEQYAAIRILYG